jgi:hypothetical protein
MTSVARLVALALAAALLLAAPAARASFTPPTTLVAGDYAVGIVAATDAQGATTAVVVGAGGRKLFRRPSSTAPWPAATPLRSDAGTPVGPVVAAAGAGAAALAWRVDRPRRYQAIVAMAADPGGVLGEPVVVSPSDANGVRHPAVAVGADGSAVLAYNTGTRAVHLSMRGGIAISLRAPGGAFETPVVVDATPSLAPAVAIADDGRGVVAWIRDRRVWAVSVDASSGTVGTPKALTPAGNFGSAVVAAGPDGAATVAWYTQPRDVPGYRVQAVHREDGRETFAAGGTQTVGRTGAHAFMRNVSMVADEQGATTLAWAPQTFGNDHSIGINGVTSGVYAASLDRGGRRFGAVQTVMKEGAADCFAPVLAARAGHAAVAFGCVTRRRATVYETPLPARGTPTTILAEPRNPRVFVSSIPLTLGLDATGLATLTTTATSHTDPARPDLRAVLTTSGR